jgi:cardiolipin synthase
LVWILWLYLLNTLFMLIVAIREVRRPANALNWITICLILPLIGFGVYLMISNPLSIHRKRLTSQHNNADRLPGSFSHSILSIANSLRHLTVSGIRTADVQVLINGPETYKILIESLKKAQKTIDIEYYIYKDDHIGRTITDLLIERALAGVQVRFLRDGLGSRKFPHHEVNRMRGAGIQCRTVFPLRLPWVMNYRDHCKIIVIDGSEAFTGGINVGDEYTGHKLSIGFWRDTHLRIKGEATIDLQMIFDVHWNMATPSVESKKVPEKRGGNLGIPGQADLSGWSGEWGSELGNVSNKTPWSHVYVQTLEGDPGIPTQVIRQAFFICLTQATRFIDITNPYFVPDVDIIMALRTAVVRGVRTRLLVPHHVDSRIVGLASRTYYGELLDAGVQIYLYNKGVLHAKSMVIDGELAAVGAANYDMRSFRLNYEVCEMLYSTQIARQLTEQFEGDLLQSIPLRKEDLAERSYTQRLLEQAARLFSPLL